MQSHHLLLDVLRGPGPKVLGRHQLDHLVQKLELAHLRVELGTARLGRRLQHRQGLDRLSLLLGHISGIKIFIEINNNDSNY